MEEVYPGEARGEETADRSWLSAHLFYQGPLELMLRQLVAPLVQDLRDRLWLAQHFFIRHWQGGPHIRCRLLAVNSSVTPDILMALRERSNGFFAAYASSDELRSEAYEQMARALALAEPDAEYLPLQPNNSVQFIDYHPEHYKYGTGMALQAVERHFEQSSDLVLDVVCRGVSAARRRVLAFAAIVASAARGFTELDRLAEALDWGRRVWGEITGLPHSGTDERVVKIYGERSDQLRAVVLAIWQRRRSTIGNTFLDGWQRSVSDLGNWLVALERQGEFTASEWTVSRWRAISEYPATTCAVDSCSHMFCNRLGITLPDEWLLRSLAARTVADLRED